MIQPFISPLYLRNKAAVKGAGEAIETANDTELVRSYFKGLNGLSSNTRESWEKQYLNEISGLSDNDKDEVFRNTVFKSLFENSTDPKDKEIWEGRHNMSLADRDIYVARKAVEQDLDGASDYKEQPLNLLRSIFSEEEAEATPKKISAKLRKSLREEATEYLGGVSGDLSSAYRTQAASLDTYEKQSLADNFDQMSREFVPNYERYIGTDKLDLSDEDKVNLAADYTAWQNVGGDQFAYRMLNQTYQDIIAGNQSIWEKAVNTGAQFVDSGAGMIIRAAGMAAGLAGIGRGEQDEDESWWDNVLDNSITRYGDRVATTQSWKTAEQQYLEENGMQDNPILNNSKQQNSIVSWNTPFEVLGQYGFTVGSTLLSFGGSGIVEAAAKGAGWVGKVATGAKGLNTTAKGVKIAKGIIRGKDIGNLLVAGSIGGVEGAMNAVGTRDQVLKDLNADIDADLNKRIDGVIDSYIISNPNEAMDMFAQSGMNLPTGADWDYIASALKSDPGVREYFGEKISPEFDERRAAAKASAQTAMNVDFIGNSIINGFINTTLQATLNAPSIQRTLRKVGLQSSPIDDLGVSIVGGETNAWKAAAKKFTKPDAVKNRFKEAWGEGVEEYTQDLSGAFGEGFAKDKMSQYLEWKYGDSEGSDAFEEDVFRNFVTGLNYMGEALTSPESIKDGLYGILSTAIGGVNANLNNRGDKGRQEGETGLQYAIRRSPVAWRSAFGPLFNNETAEVNRQRDEIAQRINEFFSDSEKQNLFFDIEASTNWMRQAQKALESGDEKAIRDAKVGELVSTLFTAGELNGSAYYDAIISNLNARANFNLDNLNNSDSAESKAADQYVADVRNRGEGISREEALQTIVKSAKDMLSMMDSIQKETASVEKLFGSEIDRDTKESLIFARVSAEDAKKRMESLDGELVKVNQALETKDNSAEASGLSKRSRRIIARFGSLNEATKSYNEMVADKQDIDADIKELEAEIKSSKNPSTQERQVLKVLKEQSRDLGRTIESAKKDIERYRSEAPKETRTTFDAEGNEVVSNVLSGREVLSAREIMGLASVDRAYMMNPENRNKYSQAQQAEIEKVEQAGTEVYSDFMSKIIDRGSLESDYTGNMRSLLKMTQEPQAFARHQQAVKTAKQRSLLNKKYDYLSEYDTTKSYAEFVSELSRIYEEEPIEDQKAAERVLRAADSAYYTRYKESGGITDGIYSKLGKNEVYNKLTDNDKNLFANALEYLVEKGVDLDNPNEVIDALGALREGQVEHSDGTITTETTSEFAEYVNKTNERVKDSEKASLTSIRDVIQIFKDVMGSLKKEAQEQVSNSKPVEVQPTTPQQSTPPQTPQPTPAPEPGIFGNGAYSSPDAGFPEGSQQPVEQTPSSTVESLRASSGDIVAKAAEVAINTTQNTPSHVANEGAVKVALNKIDSLKDGFFESAEDFSDALIKEAAQLDKTGEPENQAAANVLRRAANSAKNQGILQTKSATQQESPFTGLAARKYGYSQQVGRATGPVSALSATVSTLNIQNQKRKYPNGALTRFLEKYKVEEFLSNPEALSGEGRIIKFIVDSQLAQEVQQSMEDAGTPYTNDALPVVPVVEVKERSDHVIVVREGEEEHYYQPIGVLPATYSNWASGAARLAKLREFAGSQAPNQLVKDDAGNIISTTVIGHVTATPPKHISENKNVTRVALDVMSDESKAEMKGKSKPEIRKTDAYKKIRDKFLSRLGIRVNKYGVPEMYYATSNLKNDGNFSGFGIYRTPVHRSVDKNSTKLIVDLFREGQVAEALASNSRIKRFADALQKFFNGSVLPANLFVPDGNDGQKLSDVGQKVVRDAAERLGNILSNYMVLPGQLNGGPMKYTLTPQLRLSEGGTPVFTLSVSNNEISIPIAEIVDGKVDEQVAFTAIRNLLLDERGEARMRSDREGFMIWQIPYEDIKKMHSSQPAMNNVVDIYDDGILEASVESFDYAVNMVQFDAPFTVEGLPKYVNKTVANPENAGAQQPEATTPQGTAIEPTSGVTIEGGTGKAEAPINPATKTASEIIEKSKNIRLSDDGSTYVDTTTGKIYARVTSIIAADKEADGERFDPNNPWGLPSTNIGTGIDELVRDFFGDSLKDPNSYPNTTKEQVEKFTEQLKGLKNQLTAGGLTVIPRDVVVTGTLNAVDSEGKVHQIDVAGTLDLLAYDADGNFYIFDMKTFRTSINQEKKDKYARQLSLYKKFLEDNYGVKVKGLKIIPIKVEYPAPSKQAEYGLKEGTANQVTVNGKEYTGTKPTLNQTISLDYKEPNIEFEKLTDAEKRLVRNEIPEETTKIEQVTTAPPTATPVDTFTGMPIVGFSNPLLGDSPTPMAGQSSSFVVSNLRWGEWTGLSDEQKVSLKAGLEKVGYSKESWESNDPDIRPADSEKEHAIKCILGI